VNYEYGALVDTNMGNPESSENPLSHRYYMDYESHMDQSAIEAGTSAVKNRRITA